MPLLTYLLCPSYRQLNLNQLKVVQLNLNQLKLSPFFHLVCNHHSWLKPQSSHLDNISGLMLPLSLTIRSPYCSQIDLLKDKSGLVTHPGNSPIPMPMAPHHTWKEVQVPDCSCLISPHSLCSSHIGLLAISCVLQACLNNSFWKITKADPF